MKNDYYGLRSLNNIVERLEEKNKKHNDFVLQTRMLIGELEKEKNVLLEIKNDNCYNMAMSIQIIIEQLKNFKTDEEFQIYLKNNFEKLNFDTGKETEFLFLEVKNKIKIEKVDEKNKEETKKFEKKNKKLFKNLFKK